jgi:hypothetical protein
MKEALLKAGYVVSPNNIHSLPGVLMYPGGPGIPCPNPGREVQVLDDRIRIFTTKLFGEPYTRKSYWDTETVYVLDSVPAFLNWCRCYGTVSEPGLPAFANAHD